MDYSEITSLALSYADRTDEEVTSRVDGFLRMVEAEISRNLKVMEMSVRAVLVTSEGQEYYGLPSDFGGIRDVELRDASFSNDIQTMQYLTPEQMNNAVFYPDAGHYYTIVANQLHVHPKTDQQIIEIVYYQRIPELTSSLPTNWVSDRDPDLYIYGLLVQISAFVKDGEAKAIWQDMFSGVMSRIESNDAKVRWSGTPMQMRVN